MKEINNQAFIDGQNLAISTKCAKTPWVIDLKRFRTFLAERFNVSEAYYFIGAFDSSKQNLYSALQRFGYIVIFREHACGVLSHKKGNVDTDIVFLVMKKLVEKEDFDRVILVSGDGDYWRMVDYLIKSIMNEPAVSTFGLECIGLEGRALILDKCGRSVTVNIIRLHVRSAHMACDPGRGGHHDQKGGIGNIVKEASEGGRAYARGAGGAVRRSR